MNLLLLTLFFFSPKETISQNSLNEIRSSFHQSILDENKIKDFYNLTRTISDEDRPIAQSYKAAGYVMKAKNQWNPISKIKLVMHYQKAIDQAVQQDSNNVEIRFLRFSIAYYLPDMFGFKRNMLEDKKVLLDHISEFDISGVSPDFHRYIMWFVENSGYYTMAEVQVIRNHLNMLLAAD